MTPPALNTPPSEGIFFYNTDRKTQNRHNFTKVQNFTQGTEYYKPERILQVSRRIAVRHCERKSESYFTFPTISPPARPSTPAISQSTAVGHLPQDDYGSALSSFPAGRVPGDGKVRPLHRAGAYPPQERAGVRTRGGSPLRGDPPLSTSPLASFAPIPRIRGKIFCRFCIHPLKMLDFCSKTW